MSRINSNVPALLAIHQLKRNQDDLNVRLHRLATGLRINRGADDPAGLIISERLRAEISSIQQAMENSTRASNVVSVTEGALNESSALLLDLQALVVASANDGGLVDEELNANQLQIDSILSSLDRIANTTMFAGRKLLDGSQAYLTSGVVPGLLPSVQLFSVHVTPGGTRSVNVEVTQSAQTAQVSFIGTNASGVSTTSATTIEVRGTLGAELLSFAAGTTFGQIEASINSISFITGVSAVVSTVAVGGGASALVLHSADVGSDMFVSVSPLGGDFIATGNENTLLRGTGVNTGVLIDGQPASVKGLRADVRSGGIDARIHLDLSFAQTLSSTSFTVTGGGALFQLTPKVTPSGQTFVGFNSISTTQLGNPVDGLLYTLRSGRENSLKNKNFLTSQQIVDEAIEQVSFYRGRLGNLQRNVIQTNINSQGVALENVTASESIIRDADMAREISGLTRAQILVQTTQTTLQIANAAPQAVLQLLG